MDVGGASPRLEALRLEFHGLGHHVGREILDVCLVFRGSDLSLLFFAFLEVSKSRLKLQPRF